MTTEINRRTFIGTAAAAATAFTIVPRAVLGQGHVPRLQSPVPQNFQTRLSEFFDPAIPQVIGYLLR